VLVGLTRLEHQKLLLVRAPDARERLIVALQRGCVLCTLGELSLLLLHRSLQSLDVLVGRAHHVGEVLHVLRLLGRISAG
jgi:hypothetical protein